jgi:hypothetical protein
MIIDNNLILDTNAAITTTRDSTNVIDLSQARDIGVSEETATLDVIIQIMTAMVSATTTATLVTAIEGSTNNASYDILAETDAISTASLLAGVQVLNVHVPARKYVTGNGVAGSQPYRYLKINYLCSNTFTAGNVSAWIGAGNEDSLSYPSGFTVAN